MPFTNRDGCRIFWKLEGSSDLPTLLLLNSIGTDMGLWDRTIPHLISGFSVLRMDTRGHGASDAPDGDYSLCDLALDALAVMDSASAKQVAVAGVSLGGMVAMELALAAPERVTALALICTSAEMDPIAWAERVTKVRAEGTTAIADLAMDRFLSPGFIDANPELSQSIRRGLTWMADAGYAGAGAAIRDMQLISRIAAIKVPTLVVVGDNDVSTPSAGHGDRIKKAIPAAGLAHLSSAHLAPVEAPVELASLLRAFLLPRPEDEAAEDKLFASGLINRRRILGSEWVDRSLAARTAFNTDFQALITRVAWHEIWGRPGLDDRTRRLLVIAITASLGRWEEFRLHVSAGLSRGGFTPDELKETLMQTAIYAGLPAANTGFSEATEIIDSLAQDSSIHD